jgi:hypothetical protein
MPAAARRTSMPLRAAADRPAAAVTTKDTDQRTLTKRRKARPRAGLFISPKIEFHPPDQR